MPTSTPAAPDGTPPPTASPPLGKLLPHHRMMLLPDGSRRERHGPPPPRHRNSAILPRGPFLLFQCKLSLEQTAQLIADHQSDDKAAVDNAKRTFQGDSFTYRRFLADPAVGTDQPSSSTPGPFTSPSGATSAQSHHAILPQAMAVRPRPHDARSRTSPNIDLPTYISHASLLVAVMAKALLGPSPSGPLQARAKAKERANSCPRVTTMMTPLDHPCVKAKANTLTKALKRDPKRALRRVRVRAKAKARAMAKLDTIGTQGVASPFRCTRPLADWCFCFTLCMSLPV